MTAFGPWPRIRTSALLRRDLDRCVRSPLVWLVLGVLTGACLCGAMRARALHGRQTADLARIAATEVPWDAYVREKAARYSQPSEDVIPYWQDPTDAAGFSRYFLRRHASKPHLPLSILAVGQSDLVPFALPVKLETPFGVAPAYDFEPPRALALGSFDTAFVIVYLVPLAVAALVGLLGTYERDHGLLPLVAAQPLSARGWLISRVAAVALIAVPVVVVAVLAALAAAGAPLLSAPVETAAAAGLVIAYTLLWIGVGAVVLSFWKGAGATLAAQLAVFVVLATALPIAGRLVSDAVAPAPSTPLRVDTLRRTQDGVQAEMPAIVKAFLQARPEPHAAGLDPNSLTYATRLTILVPELERRLLPPRQAMLAHQRAEQPVASAVRTLSPPMAMSEALADLAGTGVARHRAFLDATQVYQQELRAFLYPRVHAQALSDGARACANCPGRQYFTELDALPRFSFADPPVRERVTEALVGAGALAGVAAALLAVACARSRRWPEDLA